MLVDFIRRFFLVLPKLLSWQFSCDITSEVLHDKLKPHHPRLVLNVIIFDYVQLFDRMNIVSKLIVEMACHLLV